MARESRPMSERSGTSRSYAERLAKGRPNVTFSMSTETRTLLARLAKRLNLSLSATVEHALKELGKKYR